MTGLFASQTRSHRGPGREYLAARKAQSRAKLNAFAEALANTGEVGTAADRAGVTRRQGSNFLAQMKRELGWQACNG